MPFCAVFRGATLDFNHRALLLAPFWVIVVAAFLRGGSNNGEEFDALFYGWNIELVGGVALLATLQMPSLARFAWCWKGKAPLFGDLTQ